MVLEELIAKLGFRVNGQSEAQKFIRQLEQVKKAAREAGKGLKVNFAGSGNTGLGRVTREFERAAAAARRYRQEAERASRVRMGGMGYGPGRYPGGRHPGGGFVPLPRPGRVPPGEGGGGAGGAAAGYAAGRLSRSAVGAGAIASGAAAVVAVKRFATLESAARELGITAEQSRERVAKDTETFRAQAPELGTSTERQVGIAKQFAAAGLDYETAVKSVLPVAKTAKAAFSELEPVAEAGIASINNLKIQVKDLAKAFDIMAKGGKEGQVELKDIAKALPTVASSGQKLGIKNLSGLVDIVAALEIGRKTAPTGDIAANNLYNLFEKIVSDEVGKAFKKKGMDLEKTIKENDKKGITAFDTTLDMVKKYTKGDPFRMNELFGDMQARNAINAIMQNWDEFQAMRKRIGSQAEGTVDKDFKEAMDRTAGDFDRFSAAIDRAIGRVGEFLAPGARAGMNAVTGALEGSEGKKVSETDREAMIRKLNGLLGVSPLRTSPSITADDFNKRFGSGPTARSSFGSLTDRMKWGAAAGQMPGAINPGDLTKRFGADWAKQGTQQSVTNNTTNNNDVGNDHRTQSVTVNQTVNGVPGVASAAAEGAKSGLASMGASVAKANATPTGGATAP